MANFSLSSIAKAEIRDIQRRDCLVDNDKILVDTNVVYFCYYDRWAQLASTNKGPREYQLKHYPTFLKLLLNKNVALFLHKTAILEFGHRIESAELQILYCEKSGITNPADLKLDIKQLRQLYYTEYQEIKKSLITYFAVIMKTFKLINCEESIDKFLSNCLLEWQNAFSGITDASMVAEAKKFGINSILSDDSDFVSFQGIKLYTANNLAIRCS